MELHKALRNIIQTEGSEIIKDIRIINILDDFNAYNDIPASKYILRAIIADGYSAKLLTLNVWDSQAEYLIQKFSNTTGFIVNSVDLIFQSIAYGLGLINVISNNSVPQSTKSAPQQNITTWNPKMSAEDKEDYIIGLIEFNNERESQIGITASNFSCSVKSSKEFTIYVELKKKNKNAQGTLYLTIYDLNGRIKRREYLAVVCDDYCKLSTSQCYIDFSISKIGKLYIYWE